MRTSGNIQNPTNIGTFVQLVSGLEMGSTAYMYEQHLPVTGKELVCVTLVRAFLPDGQ